MIKIAVTELDSFTLFNVDREELIEELRDDLPVYDDDFNRIEDPENYPEDKLFLTFPIKQEVNEQVKIYSDKDEKMFYVETKEKKFLVSVYQFESLYHRKNVWTLTGWDTDYIIDLDDQVMDSRSTR